MEQCKSCEDNRRIFVFGSNLKGIHGRGAALHAEKCHGAIQGEGSGHIGNSYALPTKENPYKSLQLYQIGAFVLLFVLYATNHPNLRFNVTRVGCGLAGFTDEEIGPMFSTAPSNCMLPAVWLKYKDRPETPECENCGDTISEDLYVSDGVCMSCLIGEDDEQS